MTVTMRIARDGREDDAGRVPVAECRSALGKGWRRHLAALALAWAAILILFHRDAAHLVTVWWETSTFNHCLLIPPLIAWLVWQRADGLRQVAPAAWPLGLAPLALGAAAWLLGEAGGVALARHAGLVVMLQGAVIACLGRAASRALAFPIFFALFLIPVGEELVPALQTLTAGMTAALLRLTGVSAHLDGIFITTPGGYFEVAEACAGLKFLVAMVALGALVANVGFRSWRRRAAFLAVSIAVPILANGIRAWATIWIAQRTSLAFAAGFDHVVYGGVFFALVIALVLAVAWRFFDRGVDAPWFDPGSLGSNRAAPLAWVAAAAVLVAALPQAWSSAVLASAPRGATSGFALPPVPGWQRIPASGDWRPRFAGADVLRLGRYRDSQGRAVDLAIAVYADQAEGRELIGQDNGAAPPGGRWAWTADLPAPPGGRAERIASHGLARAVVSFYRVGDVVAGSRARVKLATIRARLLGGPRHAVAVLVSAPVPPGAAGAGAAIEDFLAALGPIDRLADAAAGFSRGEAHTVEARR